MFFTKVLVLDESGPDDASQREHIRWQLGEHQDTHIVFPFLAVEGDELRELWSRVWPQDCRPDSYVCAFSGENTTLIAIPPTLDTLYYNTTKVIVDILRQQDSAFTFRLPALVILFKEQTGGLVVPAPAIADVSEITEFVVGVLQILEEPADSNDDLVSKLRKATRTRAATWFLARHAADIKAAAFELLKRFFG